jgi:uncharacterized SAM-binding protein YcdF (DUF218 family)
MSPASPHAVVILGCRVVRDARTGRLEGALSRRVEAGASVARARGPDGGMPRVVVTGGRAWRGVLEADAMAEDLRRAGIPRDRIERERRSRSTRQNARYVAAMLGPSSIAVVTCDWHLPRAVELFRAHGFDVEGVPVAGPPCGRRRRVWRWGRERVATILDRLLTRAMR